MSGNSIEFNEEIRIKCYIYACLSGVLINKFMTKPHHPTLCYYRSLQLSFQDDCSKRLYHRFWMKNEDFRSINTCPSMCTSYLWHYRK